MEGIEFEESNEYTGLSKKTPKAAIEKPSFMVRLLTKAGIADKASANLILLGVAALLFVITLFLYSGILNNGTKRTAEQQQLDQKLFGNIKF